MTNTYKETLTWKVVSIVTAVATIVSLSGVVYLTSVLNVYAAASDGVVADVTGTNPRIAAEGESERVALGMNIISEYGGTDGQVLKRFKVRLSSDDTAAEAAVSNIEKIRIYRDSTLAGTNGVFDENDPLLEELSRTETGATTVALATQAAVAVDLFEPADPGFTGSTTMFCVDDDAAGQLFLAGQAVAIDIDGTVSNRIITAVDLDGINACDNDDSSTLIGLTVDTAVTGMDLGDADDSITGLASYPVGMTALLLTDVAAAVDENDFIKIGTGATAEIVNPASKTLNLTGTSDLFVLGTAEATIYAHANAAAAREVADLTATGTVGFAAFATGESVADLTAVVGDWTASFTVPKDDSGSNSGNDIFVALVTADGVSGQTIKAQVWNDTVVTSSVDVEEGVPDGTADSVTAISSASGTTNGRTKSITFGADGVAPSILSAKTYDNTADGIVDRLVLIFNESMASSVTGTDQFEDAGGNASEIEAGTTDITLEANGEWSTTNVLNDTFTIDFTNTNFDNAANSTGDKWTFTYDQETVATDLRDATGQLLADTSLQTTDAAKPYLVSAKVKDSDGDNKIDSLEVTASETLGSGTTSTGLALKETALGTSTFTYTLGAVTSFKQSTMGGSNANDTVVIAVTERSENDVTGTFTLDYTAGSTVLDAASNEAGSRTSITTTLDVAPLVTRAQYQDNDANGKLDRVVLTLSRAVDTDANWEDDFTVAGYTTYTAVGGGDGVTTLTFSFTEKTFDTDKTPDLTYTKAAVGKVCIDEATDTDCTGGPTLETYLENVTASAVAEEDNAGPVLRTATLYDSNSDTIWSSGETLQLLFSENVSASSVVGSWANDTYTDWTFSALGATESPDSGTISVSGNLVTLTAGVSATAALASDVTPATNEVKDAAGNSAVATVTISVNPTTPPAVDRIETRDLNGNGVVDAIWVEFAGLVDASTLVAGDWKAARSSNFTFGDADSYSSTNEVTPDLTVTSVVTENGGNDTRVLVRFTEQNENTGLRPQVKYVQGSLKDLAGNLISSFNQGSDNAKLATAETTTDVTAALDGSVPMVVHKLLKDRNMNGIYDQLVLVFSEDMDQTVTSSTGWAVSGEALASSGTWSSNNLGTYDAYTFANANNIFSVDIVESDAPTSLPSVTYASSGAFKDDVSLPLASVAAGGEVSEIAVAPGVSLADGALAREMGSYDVYIIKLVGGKKFKRLILNPDIFNSYGHLSWANVQDVAAGSLAGYTTSMLIKEDVGTKVWKTSSAAGADTGTKQWLNMTPAAFEAGGYDWDAIYITNSSEVSEGFYATGADITS